MSGFFANLLSRSRGTADVVRPRLASLFEPGAPRASHVAGAMSADAPSEAQVATAPAGLAPMIASSTHGLALSRDTGSSRPAPHPRHGHDSSSHGDQHVDADTWIESHAPGGEGWDAGDEAHALAGGTQALSARVTGDAAGAARGRRHRGNRGDHGGRADHADRNVDAATAATTAAAALTFGALDGGDLTSASGGGAISASAMRAALAQALGVRTGLGVTRRNASAGDADAWDTSLASGTMPTAALIAAARPPASLAPMPVPSPSSRPHGDPSASHGSRDAAEPVIEISIGRIDVRAAVDRGPDRKASATRSSVMGLDEYLQTRARARGGSR
jgi:hypothetical protein